MMITTSELLSVRREDFDAAVAERDKLRADVERLRKTATPIAEALAGRACAVTGKKTWREARKTIWPNHLVSVEILASGLFPLLEALAATEPKP